MRRVAFLKSAPLMPFQGADISVFERLHLLKRRGWECLVICSCRDSHREGLEYILKQLDLSASFNVEAEYLEYEFLGVRCVICLGPKAEQFLTDDPNLIANLFARHLHDFSTDFLLGNLRDGLVRRYIASQPLPSLMFLTENEFPKTVDEPGYQSFIRDLEHIKNVAVASSFLRASFKSLHRRDARIFTNSVLTERYKLKKAGQGRFITMFHPYAHKGVEFFLQLVNSMPERRFLIVAGAGPEYRGRKAALQATPNLELVSFTSNPTDIYRVSRIVLVPSLWEEAFSRVIVEALCSETPVIASGTGGMKDAGGDAARYVPIRRIGHDQFELAQWQQAILKLDDPALYEERQQMGRDFIAKFEIQRDRSLDELAQWMAEQCLTRSAG